MAQIQFTKLKSILNISSDSKTTSTKASNPSQLDLKNARRGVNSDKEQPNGQPGSGPSVDLSASQKTSGQSSSRQASSTGNLLPELPTSLDLGDDMNSAVTAFKKTLARTWRPTSPPPERGTVLFSGMVEVVGSKGLATLDIAAFYHAAESRWTNISIGVRRVQSRKQGPRGGI